MLFRKRIEQAIARFVPDEIAAQIVSKPEDVQLRTEKMSATVMSTDVQGFSEAFESPSPEQLARFLGSYLTEMSGIVIEHKGTILRYTGDAIEAVFGAPTSSSEHAVDACLSAIRMREREVELSRTLQQEKGAPAPLRTRIGISTGDMLVGLFGSPYRMQYGAMGYEVNLASRLEGLNRQFGTFVLVSEETYRQTHGRFVFRKLARIMAVGRFPLRLYELVADTKERMEPKVEDLMSTFHQGVDLFEKGQWTAAKESFASCIKIVADDGPSKFFHRRCEEYLRQPPSIPVDNAP
jgi:adenylate cyclase